MNRSIHLLAAVGTLVVAACSGGSDVTAPASAPEYSNGRAVGQAVSMMTRNLYIGFDADAAIAALATGDPTIFGPVLQASIATLQQTDFPTRAKTFAAEIAENRPHAVGLQEVYEIHADLSGLGIPMTIDLDYLAILQAALAERHLPYVVVAKVLNTDIQPLPGIRLLDQEVLLVDASRVKLEGDVIARTFQNNIGVLAPGVDKKAGYIVAPVKIRSVRVTLVTTHLESDVGPGSYPLVSQLRAEAAEIAAVLGTTQRAIVVGDLNDVVGSPMYQVFQNAGFTDTWLALHPADPGPTGSCFGPALSDPVANCQQRIDYFFARGFTGADGLRATELRIGIQPSARRLGPFGLIWPSDHAGLVGAFTAHQN